MSNDIKYGLLFLIVHAYSYRKIGDIHCEMTCTFDKFNIELLNHFRSIPYKYVIMNSPKVVDKDDCFEYLHAHKHLGDVNRCLQLSPEMFHHIHLMCE